MKGKRLLILGAAFGLGLSACAGAAQTRRMTPLKTVTAGTYTLTIDASDFNTTSYAANNNEKTSNAVLSTDSNTTYEVKWTSYQVMKNGENMQWQKSKGYIYNSTDLGTINSVTVNSSDGTFTTYYGTSEQPSSGTTVGNGYFKTSVGSDTGKTSSIVVVFAIAESNKEDVDLSCDDLELDVSDTPETLIVAATSNGETVNNLSYTYEVSDTSIATVSSSGVVTPVAIGETELTINFAGNDDYNAASTTISVVISDRTLTTSSLVFTAACGGSGTADDGAEWTVTSDGTESSFDSTSGIHYGTGSANVTYLQLSTSDLIGNIKRVVVNARDAQATAIISVMVGSTAFTCTGSTTATNSSANYIFTGNARGEIVVRIDRGSSMLKALYVKSVVVNYEKITVSSIALSGTYQTSFNQGDEFNHSGMVVTATYSDSSTGDVSSEAVWSGYNMLNTGTQTITVTYQGKTATYDINVVASVMYTVGGTIQNGSLSSTDSVKENNALNITVNADDKYSRPASLVVTMGGNSLSAGTGYTYDSSTGAFSIASVTGNVVINGECDKITGYWEDLPYTVAQARAAIDAGTNVTGVYATGVVSEIVTAFDSQYGNITYNISSDGSTESDQLQAFRGKDKNGASFTSEDDVQVGATVVVYGNLTKYGDTYEFAANNQLISYVAPSEEDELNAHLNSCSSVSTIHGLETVSFGDESTSAVTFSDNWNADTDFSSILIGNISMVGNKGSNTNNSPKYYSNGSALRFYNGNTLTFGSIGYYVTSIELTYSGSSYAKDLDSDVGTFELDSDNLKGTWSGSSNTVVLTGTETTRVSSVSVTYKEASTSVSSVAVRFGATLTKSNWDAITSKWTISDYGVMLLKQTTLNNYGFSSVEAAYRANDAEKPVTILSKGSGDAPYLDDDNNYLFTVKVNVKEANYGVVFCAAPFIVVNGEYRFLDEMQYSVNTLAQYYLENGGSNLSDAALTVLADN